MNADLGPVHAMTSAGVSAVTAKPIDPSTVQKIQKNAQEFEGILIRQMLRELRESPFAPQGDIMSKAYQEAADDQMAKQMAQAGGLGFGKAMAEMMMRQIQQASLINSSDLAVTPRATGAQ